MQVSYKNDSNFNPTSFKQQWTNDQVVSGNASKAYTMQNEYGECSFGKVGSAPKVIAQYLAGVDCGQSRAYLR